MEDIVKVIKEIAKQKEISESVLFDSLEVALLTAYKKNFGTNRKAKINIDRDTGEIKVFSIYTVVEEVENPQSEISLEEAKAKDKSYEIGDTLEIVETPKDFGRISAIAAKQVVIQRIREAERSTIYNEYKSREHEILYSRVQRISGGNVYFNLGKTEAVLPPSEQTVGEKYRLGDRIRTYITKVKENTKSPEIILSRTHPGLVKRLFELEVPEILEGDVIIKNIARDAGSRTKIAVMANAANIDPVGSCVGHKGRRVNAIVEELFGEKIDIIPYDEDITEFVKNALSPSKVVKVIKQEASLLAVVPDHQLSLAIGKEGQNAKLAGKLTGTMIDIVTESEYEEKYESKETTS